MGTHGLVLGCQAGGGFLVCLVVVLLLWCVCQRFFAVGSLMLMVFIVRLFVFGVQWLGDHS